MQVDLAKEWKRATPTRTWLEIWLELEQAFHVANEPGDRIRITQAQWTCTREAASNSEKWHFVELPHRGDYKLFATQPEAYRFMQRMESLGIETDYHQQDPEWYEEERA